MLGVNQGIIMVLAVVVIGGLVGSGALGDEVARGLQRNEFGQGVVASLAILALGIALDRVTQSRGRRDEEVNHDEGNSNAEQEGARRDRRARPRCGHDGRRVRREEGGDDREQRVGQQRDRGQGLRQGRAQRAGVGRLDGQHLHRQERARGEPRLPGRDHQGGRDPGLPGDGRRRGGRRARGLAAHRRVQEVHRPGRHRRRRRPARRRGPHRLVHPEVPDGRAPGVRRLGGPEGRGGPVQDRRVRRPGHVPRRRSLLRPEGQGADRGARPEPQARDGRRRAGAGRALEPALQAEEAGPLLLVHAAVLQPGVRPGRGQAPRSARRTARTTRRPAATSTSTSARTTSR